MWGRLLTCGGLPIRLPRLSLALALALAPLACSSPAGFNERVFYLTDEFYGADAYTGPDVSSNLRNAMANSLALFPPVDSGMAQFVATQNTALMVNLAGSTSAAGFSSSYIDTQRAGMASLAASLGNERVLWNLMPEWDQGGGPWVPQGRPDYTNLSKSDAASKFLNYYLTQTTPLSTYLSIPSPRAFTYAAVTDYSANAAYAYDLGVDTVMLERSIDELADISTGVAFLRGAARQYDRQWGIDISTWRTSNGMATTFNSQGVLLGGWSPSYLKNHYYIAYLSGANVLKTEATLYYYTRNSLNPFGAMAKAFADFALNRHPDVGRPAVTMALLVDHNSGFDPKHNIYNQGNTVWYGDINYSEGDFMINNFLRLAFPNHWLHGLTPGAPFADSTGKPNTAQFQAYLAAGGDPRPYEPMSFTRWGDNLDIITSHAGINTFRNYKIIMVLGDVPFTSQLQQDLQGWVQEGGTLVINANQLATTDESFLGVGVKTTAKTATAARWQADGSNYQESSFQYTTVVPSTAQVLATANGSDPIITTNAYGKGHVIITTPRYLQTSARDQILNIGTRLLDWLQSQYSVAQVSGPPIEYIVNQASYGIVVALLNHTGTDWSGNITTNTFDQVSAVKEYTADTAAPWSANGATITVNATVPAWDVRVYGIELTDAAKFRIPTQPAVKKTH
jgi:hypothetical protein